MFTFNLFVSIWIYLARATNYNTQRKEKITVGNGFAANPFEEIDHDAERLAKEFERKYGNSYGGSDSRSMKNSVPDKGSGYDENNGFIDDSEAVSCLFLYFQSVSVKIMNELKRKNNCFLDFFGQFDEIIPDEMDTDRGGFYINSGQLQYKRLANFEREGETNERTPKPRKVKHFT